MEGHSFKLFSRRQANVCSTKHLLWSISELCNRWLVLYSMHLHFLWMTIWMTCCVTALYRSQLLSKHTHLIPSWAWISWYVTFKGGSSFYAEINAISYVTSHIREKVTWEPFFRRKDTQVHLSQHRQTNKSTTKPHLPHSPFYPVLEAM